MRASSDNQRQWRGQSGKIKDTKKKNDDFIAGITHVYAKSAAVVCGLQLGWVMSIAGMVES